MPVLLALTGQLTVLPVKQKTSVRSRACRRASCSLSARRKISRVEASICME